jgi:hypothetical protein
MEYVGRVPAPPLDRFIDDGQHLLEDPHVVLQGDRVLHLRFKVRR